MLQGILGWLTSLPPILLYLALAVTAALENVFPPFPADTIVAFGAFLAAHGEASLTGAFLATWLGNVGGALFMLWVGRRFGTAQLQRRFPSLGARDSTRAERLERLYARYGVPALFVSRFIPGARALVPPLAGAMHIAVFPVALAIVIASGVWYGAIAWLAYHLGTRWDDLSAYVGSLGRWSAVGALAIVAVVLIVVYVRRKRRRQWEEA